MLAAPGGELAHGQSHHQQQDLGDQVLVPRDAERVVGAGEEEIEGEGGHQGGHRGGQPASGAGHRHDDHHQEEGVVGGVQPIPPWDQSGGRGDGGGDRGHHDPAVRAPESHPGRAAPPPAGPRTVDRATVSVWSPFPHTHCHTPGGPPEVHLRVVSRPATVFADNLRLIRYFSRLLRCLTATPFGATKSAWKGPIHHPRRV